MVALAVVALRWLVLLAAGAVAGAATAVGLLLSGHGGLFGFTAAFVLLLAPGLLALSPLARAAAKPAVPVPSYG